MEFTHHTSECFADGVVIIEMIIDEKGVEYGADNDVLTEHFCGLLRVDTIIDILLQSFEVAVECLVYIGIAFENIIHVRDDVEGDFADIGGPAFPIVSGTDLVHEFGEYLLLVGFKEFELTGNAHFGLLFIAHLQIVAIVFDGISLVASRTDNEFAGFRVISAGFGLEIRRFCHVQAYRIDLRIEVFIV